MHLWIQGLKEQYDNQFKPVIEDFLDPLLPLFEEGPNEVDIYLYDNGQKAKIIKTRKMDSESFEAITSKLGDFEDGLIYVRTEKEKSDPIDIQFPAVGLSGYSGSLQSWNSLRVSKIAC